MHWLCRTLAYAIVLAALSSTASAQGRYLTVLSTANPNAPTLTVLDENLQPLGTVNVPAGTRQVLLSDDGTKLIVIADNAQTPLAFVDLAAGVPGQVRTLPLGSGAGVQGVLSRDGSLLYLVTKNPPMLHPILVGTEQTSGSPVPLPGDPIEAEITLDGEYLLVLCPPNLVAPIRLSNLQPLVPQAITNVAGGSNLSLSLAPFGSIFITVPNALVELRGTPPFDEIARTPLVGTQLTHPGKLQFSPVNGKRAYSANQVQNGHSAGIFDFSLRSASNPAGSYAGGAVVLGSAGGPFGTTPELILPLRVYREFAAVGLAPALQQVYLFSSAPGGGVLVNDLRIGQVPVTGVESLAVSGEFPNALYLFYNTNLGVVSRFPLSAVGSVISRAVLPGKLQWHGTPSNSAPGNLYGYGDDATVPPSATLRYLVRVMDASGRPVKGRIVNFQALTTGVTLSTTLATTDRNGWVYVDVIAPAEAGNFTVQVTSGNVAPITLVSRVSAPGGGGGSGGGGTGGGGGGQGQARLIKVAGDGQLAQLGAVAGTLVVRAVDAEGKPSAGKQVQWQSTSVGLQFLSNSQTTTDSDGKAQVSIFFFGSIPFGESFLQGQVEAVSDIGNVTFYVTAYPTEQFGTPSTQLLKPDASNKVLEARLGKPLEAAIQYRIVSGGGQGRPFGIPIPKVGL